MRAALASALTLVVAGLAFCQEPPNQPPRPYNPEPMIEGSVSPAATTKKELELHFLTLTSTDRDTWLRVLNNNPIYTIESSTTHGYDVSESLDDLSSTIEAVSVSGYAGGSVTFTLTLRTKSLPRGVSEIIFVDEYALTDPHPGFQTDVRVRDAQRFIQQTVVVSRQL